METPGINKEPFTLVFEEGWFNGSKLEEQVYLMNIYLALTEGKLSFEQQKECFEIICKYPRYFTVHEPVQQGTDFVYTIDVHLDL